MTTIQIYSSTADGFIWADGSGARTATTGNGVNATSVTNLMGYLSVNYDSSFIRYYRAFFYFDTSTIPSGATINSVKLYINCTAIDQVPSIPTISAQKGTQASTLTVDDWDNFSGNYYGYTAVSSTGLFYINFNSTGISDLNLSGITKICLKEYDHDYLGGSVSNNDSIGIYGSYAEDTSNKPYLEIDYTPAATGTNMQINIGDAWKTVDSLQINIGDVWKDVVSVQQNVGDVWKTVF